MNNRNEVDIDYDQVIMIPTVAIMNATRTYLMIY